jgi:hypothetical protein
MPGKNSAIELHPQALFFEIESPYVAQPGLNLVTLLPFKCRGLGPVPPCLHFTYSFVIKKYSHVFKLFS